MAITQDRRNYRIHTEQNLQAISKSLQDCGAGRSILIDKDDEIIAGNGCYQEAEKLGIPVRIVETDGSELIAVKRTDIGQGDQKRKQLAIMDNSTSDLSFFDENMLQQDCTLQDLRDWSAADIRSQLDNQNTGDGTEEFDETEMLFPVEVGADHEDYQTICRFKMKNGIKKDTDAVKKLCRTYRAMEEEYKKYQELNAQLERKLQQND